MDTHVQKKSPLHAFELELAMIPRQLCKEMDFSVWCGRTCLTCTDPWPQPPHPTSLGWTETLAVSQTLSPSTSVGSSLMLLWLKGSSIVLSFGMHSTLHKLLFFCFWCESQVKSGLSKLRPYSVIYVIYIYIYIAICVSPQNKSCPQTYGPIPWKIKRGGKNPKVNPKVKRFTLVSGGGCIDFTLKAPGWAWHYQSNSLIWTSKTSSAIGFLPFSIPLSGIYEQQLSARCTLA